jgi:hypothetical protein
MLGAEQCGVKKAENTVLLPVGRPKPDSQHRTQSRFEHGPEKACCLKQKQRNSTQLLAAAPQEAVVASGSALPTSLGSTTSL